jgi:hypothetical protein
MRFVTRASELRDWLPQVHLRRTNESVDPVAFEAVIDAVLQVGAHQVEK